MPLPHIPQSVFVPVRKDALKALATLPFLLDDSNPDNEPALKAISLKRRGV